MECQGNERIRMSSENFSRWQISALYRGRLWYLPIWHRETELQMMNLQTGAIDLLENVNSDRSKPIIAGHRTADGSYLPANEETVNTGNLISAM